MPGGCPQCVPDYTAKRRWHPANFYVNYETFGHRFVCGECYNKNSQARRERRATAEPACVPEEGVSRLSGMTLRPRESPSPRYVSVSVPRGRGSSSPVSWAAASRRTQGRRLAEASKRVGTPLVPLESVKGGAVVRRQDAANERVVQMLADLLVEKLKAGESRRHLNTSISVPLALLHRAEWKLSAVNRLLLERGCTEVVTDYAYKVCDFRADMSVDTRTRTLFQREYRASPVLKSIEGQLSEWLSSPGVVHVLPSGASSSPNAYELAYVSWRAAHEAYVQWCLANSARAISCPVFTDALKRGGIRRYRKVRCACTTCYELLELLSEMLHDLKNLLNTLVDECDRASLEKLIKRVELAFESAIRLDRLHFVQVRVGVGRVVTCCI